MDWWETHRPAFDLYVSEFVITEDELMEVSE